MMTAMRAAENVLGAKHDLWAINTEAEYHEERRETNPSAKPRPSGRPDRAAEADQLSPGPSHDTKAREGHEERKPA